MQLLDFVFSSFWHWLGTMAALVVVCHTAIMIAESIGGKNAD